MTTRKYQCPNCKKWSYPNIFMHDNNAVGRCTSCDRFIKNIPHDELTAEDHKFIRMWEEGEREDREAQREQERSEMTYSERIRQLEFQVDLILDHLGIDDIN